MYISRYVYVHRLVHNMCQGPVMQHDTSMCDRCMLSASRNSIHNFVMAESSMAAQRYTDEFQYRNWFLMRQDPFSTPNIIKWRIKGQLRQTIIT